MDMTENMEAMIARGQDGAPLRLALASRYAAAGQIERALEHAEVAVRIDHDYSAAWKLLGKLRGESGQSERAIEAFEVGIEVAEKRGDKQAAKEMRVFLNRLRRTQQGRGQDE
jgi:Tfp pilus assembly protein PilF